MKPTVQITDQTRELDAPHHRLPVTDFNFQSVGLSDYNARCANLSTSNSFRVTREYFDTEAHRDFLAEAAVFSAVMLTVCMHCA